VDEKNKAEMAKLAEKHTKRPRRIGLMVLWNVFGLITMEIYASDTAVANGGTIKEQKKVMNGGRKNLTRAEKEKGPAP